MEAMVQNSIILPNQMLKRINNWRKKYIRGQVNYSPCFLGIMIAREVTVVFIGRTKIVIGKHQNWYF
jgi:hypothetical protein